MNITAFFAHQGVPAEELTPTIKIRDLSDNSVVVNSVAMTEVGDGFYKYSFAVFNAAKDYVIRCDGGATLDNSERYAISGSAAAGEISSLVSDQATIKAKTDNLPSDPADQSAIEAAITAATSVLATSAALATVDSLIDAIKAILDKFDGEITDATSLTAGSLMDRLRTLGWILRNKMIITNSSGDTIIYKDDGTTQAFDVPAALTNVSGITTRKRLVP